MKQSCWFSTGRVLAARRDDELRPWDRRVAAHVARTRRCARPVTKSFPIRVRLVLKLSLYFTIAYSVLYTAMTVELFLFISVSSRLSDPFRYLLLQLQSRRTDTPRSPYNEAIAALRWRDRIRVGANSSFNERHHTTDAPFPCPTRALVRPVRAFGRSTRAIAPSRPRVSADRPGPCQA